MTVILGVNSFIDWWVNGRSVFERVLKSGRKKLLFILTFLHTTNLGAVPNLGVLDRQNIFWLFFVCEKSEKTSQYKGVSWIKKNRKWQAYVVNAGKLKYGGTFDGELDAARRVNQLCEELEIPFQNPGISSIPMQQYQVT